MSIHAFPQYSFWKVADTSETVFAGGFTMGNAQQVYQLITHLYKHGTGAGTEKIRAKIFLDAAMTNLYATSDWFVISEITTLSQYWRGTIAFTFTGKPYVESAKNYYIGFETTGYTRNGDTFYMSYLLDDFEPVNSGFIALHCAFLGYRKIESEQ